MSKEIYNFKRVETKYRISKSQKDLLFEKIKDHLIEDEHGRSTINSLYLDTDDFLLIRNSIDGKVYKEKLRIRSYGTPTNDSKIFLEIKKKYKKVVYKRRVKMKYSDAIEYIKSGKKKIDSQIMNEIDYAFHYYRKPRPSFMIAYERDAYYVKDNLNIRLTFDSNIRYRTNDLSLLNGTYGKQILPDDECILEVKSNGAMPLWLSKVLNECKIYPQSYSKYKNSYIDYNLNN